MSSTGEKVISASVKRLPEEVYWAYLNRDELASGGVVPPNWTSDGAGLLLVEGSREHTRIVRLDLNTGKVVTVFDVSALQASAAAGPRPSLQHPPSETFYADAGRHIIFRYDGSLWSLDLHSNHLQRRSDVPSGFRISRALMAQSVAPPATWQRVDYLGATLDVPELPSPDGKWFASIRAHNVVVCSASARGGQERRLTTDGAPESYWDLEAQRIKVESGRRCTFGVISPWSPDSLTLLAYRRDITGVPRIPRVNWLSPFVDVEFLPWQMTGARLDRVQPVLVDVRSARQTPVPLQDTEDRYIQLLAWRHDASEALIAVYTRDFKCVEVIATDRQTGTARSVLTEHSATFVRIQSDAIFSGEHGFNLLPDDSGFLWSSTRSGWNHLYYYDMRGTLIRQLTSGDWPIHRVEHIGTDGFVYFTASVDAARPYDVHVCRVPLEGGELQRLTRETGIHVPLFAPAGYAFLDTHSAVARPARTDLVRSSGSTVKVLAEMDIAPLKAVGYTPPEEFTVKAADGTTDLWGVLYKPYNFDPSRAWPVIEYIYGGPQTVESPRYFAINHSVVPSMRSVWALAQLGYIVICVDARGTPGRSKAFHDVVYANWRVGLADHVAAVRQLCERHRWMDANRIGITGHSWGGYFSICALMAAPDTYHAAVSYAPHCDPWDSILYEPYLGLPQKGQVAYEQADLFREASEVKGHLMILAGTSDNGFSSTMKMTRALIEAGIDHECVVVPGALHHFQGVEEEYLLMKLTGWFDRYVKHRKK